MMEHETSALAEPSFHCDGAEVPKEDAFAGARETALSRAAKVRAMADFLRIFIIFLNQELSS